MSSKRKMGDDVGLVQGHIVELIFEVILAEYVANPGESRPAWWTTGCL